MTVHAHTSGCTVLIWIPSTWVKVNTECADTWWLHLCLCVSQVEPFELNTNQGLPCEIRIIVSWMEFSLAWPDLLTLFISDSCIHLDSKTKTLLELFESSVSNFLQQYYNLMFNYKDFLLTLIATLAAWNHFYLKVRYNWYNRLFSAYHLYECMSKYITDSENETIEHHPKPNQRKQRLSAPQVDH